VIRLATIGFTRSSAEHFFGRLAAAGVRTVVDVRLHNRSQLAGFAKEGDLAWFLRTIGGIAYRAEPMLAPTAPMLAAYRGKQTGWPEYEAAFRGLLARRRAEAAIAPESLDGACLLCSEAAPHHCHRRVAAEYLTERWGRPVAIDHL
jgi:uncharacterized protein (DUF488 family)